ncbi:hypothetical protein ACJQWK_04664 [Exserohilum turcicum]|uniref:Uncharacterized protein n=1 Tax=Exserohilum turcicum (strain 28A) TaxID=671987 RepID=R0JZ39_EXST2|nr:uncharacterized protein SETTUDRAFT_34265 [Exserohilum turcica Et28A]EOA82729.1 hypothetical protein SETTUDRAFT_34265 [Exserohilum turcica Et28A]
MIGIPTGLLVLSLALQRCRIIQCRWRRSADYRAHRNERWWRRFWAYMNYAVSLKWKRPSRRVRIAEQQQQSVALADMDVSSSDEGDSGDYAGPAGLSTIRELDETAGTEHQAGPAQVQKEPQVQTESSIQEELQAQTEIQEQSEPQPQQPESSQPRNISSEPNSRRGSTSFRSLFIRPRSHSARI